MSNEKLPELSENEGGALSLLLKVIDNAGNPTGVMVIWGVIRLHCWIFAVYYGLV